MTKAKITFAETEQTVLVPVGTRLMDVSEDIDTGIVYGCRQCDCGRCMVEVVDGNAGLMPPSVLEQRVLEHHEAGASSRLACQVRIQGDVTLRPRTV